LKIIIFWCSVCAAVVNVVIAVVVAAAVAVVIGTYFSFKYS